MQPSDPCPWCGDDPHCNAAHGVACCSRAQDAEEACEALDASEPPDEVLEAAALTYWPELAADLPVIRQRLSHQPQMLGTEHLNHTTNGAQRAA